MSTLNEATISREPRRSPALCSALLLVLAFWPHPRLLALGQERYVEDANSPGSCGLVQQGVAAHLCVDAEDYWGGVRAVGDLRSDIGRVTGCTPDIVHEASPLGSPIVLIGTIGQSRTIDQLIKSGKLDPTPIAGKWESFIVQVVPNPLPGVDRGLVIAGSDKRGTIYGVYDVSEQIGVSPWSWWADVPVAHREALFVKPGRFVQGPPAVKYRGIFLNDEAPCLTAWTDEKFGGRNHQFYEKVFERLLRLKANYLWPAMWFSTVGGLQSGQTYTLGVAALTAAGEGAVTTTPPFAVSV